MSKEFPNNSDRIVQLVYWVAYRLHLVWAFMFRPATEGVWVAVWSDGNLLLIKNSYRNTITLPGGGMDNNETPVAAAIRELSEEVGIDTTPDQLSLFARYSSTCEFKRDCINLFELELEQALVVEIDHREVSWFAVCSPEQALSVDIVSCPQGKHALAVQSGRFGWWCALVHKANACHLPVETARSLMSWRMIIAKYGTTAHGLRIDMMRPQMPFICVM